MYLAGGGATYVLSIWRVLCSMTNYTVYHLRQEWYKHSARLNDRASQLPVLEHALLRLSRRLFFDSFSAASPRAAAPDLLVTSRSPASNTASRPLLTPSLPHVFRNGDPGSGSLRGGGAFLATMDGRTMSGGGEEGGLRARDSNHGERVCGSEVRGPQAMSPGFLSTLSTAAASASASVSSCGREGNDQGGGAERSPDVGSGKGDIKHVLVLSSDRTRCARACEQCEKLFTDNKRLFHDNQRLFRENKRLFHDNQRLFRQAADLRRMSAQLNKVPSTDSPNGGEGGPGIFVSIKRGGRSLQVHQPSARAEVEVAGTLDGGEEREGEAARERLSPQHPFSCEASFSAPASSPPASAASLAPTPEATASSTPEHFARATDSLMPVEDSRAPLEGGSNGHDGATLSSAARQPPEPTLTSDPAAAPATQLRCGGDLQPLTARQVGVSSDAHTRTVLSAGCDQGGSGTRVVY